MLVTDAVNSKSIALTATNNHSNEIPYLGQRWFPEEKRSGLELKWIKTSTGLPVTLAASKLDAIPTLRARGGFDIEKTQMAFFREQMMLTETDMQEIDRIRDTNDPYLNSALQSVYDDTNKLIAGAEVVPEIMRMQLLTAPNGTPSITIADANANYTYNYDPKGTYKQNNYAEIASGFMWKSNPSTAKPLTDLNNAKKQLKKKGKIVKYALMTTTTFGYLLECKQVKDAILAQNQTANIFMNEALVSQVIKAATGLSIVIYDKMYTDYTGTDKNFYPDDQVTLLPEGKLGKTWFGTTPEMRSAGQMKEADVTIYKTGISITTHTTSTVPIQTTVTASEVVLPSYENMESTFVLKVEQ